MNSQNALQSHLGTIDGFIKAPIMKRSIDLSLQDPSNLIDKPLDVSDLSRKNYSSISQVAK